jgi:hypothetical protein
LFCICTATVAPVRFSYTILAAAAGQHNRGARRPSFERPPPATVQSAPVQPRRRQAVYRAYWQLAAERQRIFRARHAGRPAPWTSDPILAKYKFCNTFRASDRASQFLIGRVIYNRLPISPEDEFLRIVLFRLFSRPETWVALEAATGSIGTASLRRGRLAAALDQLWSRGQKLYTGAFILCANRAFGHKRKHHNHLALLELMLRERLPTQIARARSLKEVYERLTAYPLLGPFMAYQIAIDLNYSELIDFSEDEFTVAGPGARRGIAKCFIDTAGWSDARIIHWMVDNQQSECERLGVDLPTLWGRPLRAIDCQNLFCEIDKYARVAFPNLKSDRQRIKTIFTPTLAPLPAFYPPKWGINEQIPPALTAIAAEPTPLAS